MSVFSEADLTHFEEHGYVILHDAVPPRLRDLRGREHDRVRDRAS